MPLDTDKFLVPDGLPSGGIQKMKSISQGVGSIAQSDSFQLLALTTQLTPPDESDKFIVWNNATQNAATKLFINHTGRDAQSYQQLLEVVDLVGSRLVFVQVNDPDQYQVWQVDTITSQTGYVELDVTLLAENGGNFTDADELVIHIDIPETPLVKSRIVAFVEEDLSVIDVPVSGYHDINVTLADAGDSVDFVIESGNQIKYTGTETKKFTIAFDYTGEKDAGGGGQNCNVSMFKQGTIKLDGKQSLFLESGQRNAASIHQKVELETDQYALPRLENITGNNDIKNIDVTITIEEF